MPLDVNWKLNFDKPQSIQVLGSWPLKTSTKLRSNKRTWECQLGLTLPSSLVQEKDFSNDRFIFKQAFYLSLLKHSLNKSSLNVNAELFYRNSDFKLPSLIISSNEKHLKSSYIQLIPCLPSPTPFRSLNRISPSKIGLQYSNALLTPSVLTPHLVYLHQVASLVPAFRDSVRLLKIWANQRSLNWVFNDLNAEFIVALLVEGEEQSSTKSKQNIRKKVGKGLSSYQLFKAAIEFLAHQDFSNDAIFMKLANGSTPLSQDDFSNNSELTFVDPSGTINLLTFMLPEDMKLISIEAQVTLESLEDDQDRFNETFMKDLRHQLPKFDIVGNAKLSKKLIKKVNDSYDKSVEIKSIRQSIASTLTKALGSRSRAISLEIDENYENMNIGILLDSNNFNRLVDHGPPAEDKEGCQTFRSFWGSVSELRRFKDGKISESVVWNSVENRNLIPIEIIRWILNYHFKIDNVEFLVEDFELLLNVDEVEGVESFNDFDGPIQIYDSLQRLLRDMTNIPLEIMSVMPCTPYLRYTSTYPQPTRKMTLWGLTPPTSSFVPSAEIVLNFESSGKWPDDLCAIQRIKLALLEAISKELKNVDDEYQSQVVVDYPPRHDWEDGCSLEIISPQGYVFKARIQHDRQLTLLDGIINNKSHFRDSDRAFAKKVYSDYINTFHLSPRHHLAIVSLHHKFNAYSKTVRLVSRWINAHLLGNHVPHEIIELLVAKVFIDPGAYNVPSTSGLGFLRTVMLLTEWKWKSEPLIVGLYTATEDEHRNHNSFPIDKLEQVEKSFEIQRRQDEHITSQAMFIATENDTQGLQFGKSKPSKVIVNRLQQIAKATLEAMLSQSENFNILQLFKSPLNTYNFIIHVKKSLNTRHYQSLEHLGGSDGELLNDDPLVDFDAASMLVEELESVYGDILLFFHDTCGGCQIAALWNPSYSHSSRFKVGNNYPSKPIENVSNLFLNIIISIVD